MNYNHHCARLDFSFQLHFDQVFDARIVGPDSYKYQSSFFYQDPQFLLRTTLNGTEGHQRPIHGSYGTRRDLIEDDVLNKVNFGVAIEHGRVKILKHLQARGVVSIIQYKVKLGFLCRDRRPD